MSKRNELVAKLNEAGVNAQAYDKVTNGVTFEGIMIPDGTTFSPVVYPDDNMTAEQVVRMIEHARETQLDSRILTAEFVNDHVKVGMMRSSASDSVMRKPSPYNGIDWYLYVDMDKFSYKLPANYPYDVWDVAYRNTVAETELIGMTEMLFGIKTEDEHMYVLTNKSRFRGAGNIIDKEAIRNKGIGNKLFAIPSSIHEWILLPYSDDMSPEDIGNMIREINGDIVSPEDQLGDRVYILEV